MATVFNLNGDCLGTTEEINQKMGESATGQESLSNELIRSHTPLHIKPLKKEQPLPHQLRNLITNKGHNQ